MRRHMESQAETSRDREIEREREQSWNKQHAILKDDNTKWRGEGEEPPAGGGGA